eukprot:6471984-Prymnesium_polylepis.1
MQSERYLAVCLDAQTMLRAGSEHLGIPPRALAPHGQPLACGIATQAENSAASDFGGHDCLWVKTKLANMSLCGLQGIQSMVNVIVVEKSIVKGTDLGKGVRLLHQITQQWVLGHSTDDVFSLLAQLGSGVGANVADIASDHELLSIDFQITGAFGKVWQRPCILHELILILRSGRPRQHCLLARIV